ncbi:hypothetical protein NR402_17800 [Acidithiobacillus ferrooxidans]|uniref:DUF6602 domain-containing protein n=1 Tax=Acidithiobacillus ferrooxidans TaxID=920 RepID=UPI0013D27454|nr:DUF6602 domain-containing protein [Acidithiobacillus ferrooxidans]MCR2832100.1 hypothetical protein [Acidithiobacillus ferrooxidans]MDA8119011.1 hypothetical protein [Gammaproteobacteria bacterium]
MSTEQYGSPENEQFLRDAFASEQECLAASLKSSFRITHNGDRGEVNEQFFIDFLRAYLPNRYTVEKAIVLDSLGQVSHSIDIVVFDRQYTPTLLDNEKHRYVPAEAVYAVFECKPTIDKGYLEYAADKIASVRKLHRTSVNIHHAGGVFKKKELFPIVGGILAANVEWADGLGDSFRKNHQALIGDKQVDCGFAASGACFDIFADQNAYTFGPPENALAYFAFRLLWKLQSLATVPAVDWMAYARTLARSNDV